MESRKMVLMNLLAVQKRRCRHKEQTVDTVGEGECGRNWEQHGDKCFPGGSDTKESACSVGDLGVIPGWGRSLGRGHGNPLQYSCLENPDRHRCLQMVGRWRVRHDWATKQRRAHGNKYITICKRGHQWEFAIRCREFRSGVLWQSRGKGHGKELQERGDMCIPIADSPWCMAETITIL